MRLQLKLCFDVYGSCIWKTHAEALAALMHRRPWHGLGQGRLACLTKLSSGLKMF